MQISPIKKRRIVTHAAAAGAVINRLLGRGIFVTIRHATFRARHHIFVR
jgi:hypothetical protein